jgi:hypothetical protein
MIVLYIILSYFIYYFLLGTRDFDRNDLVDGIMLGFVSPIVVPILLVALALKYTFILGKKFKNRSNK